MGKAENFFWEKFNALSINKDHICLILKKIGRNNDLIAEIGELSSEYYNLGRA